MAIHLSRKSLYWERDKSQARFDQFDKTSTVEKMAGDPLTPEPNPHNASLSKHNHWSLFFLMFGLVTLCMFALINISVTKFPRGASNITTASATNNSSEPVISKLSVKTN